MAGIGALFGGGSSSPAPQKPPAPMPTPDDQAIRDAKRKKNAAQSERSGRLSTFLSGADGGADKLGG